MNRFFSTPLGLPYSLIILQFSFKTPLLTSQWRGKPWGIILALNTTASPAEDRQAGSWPWALVKPRWRWCEWTQDKNLFWPKGKKLDHCGSLLGIQTMKVNPDNPSELSFKEVLKDKNASRFFPVLTAKGSSEGRETISSLQQAHVLNANKGSRAGQNLSGEQDLQEPRGVGPGNPRTVPLED